LMGHNAIDRAGRDSWTITPKIVQAARSDRASAAASGDSGTAAFNRLFRDPATRDPRGYIIPASQPDFLTATKFVNILLDTGVKGHRATADFEVAGKKYPAGSYVIQGAHPFRAHAPD